MVKCLFVFVKHTDAFTLLNILYQYIAPNSIIYSDCWSSYNRIRYLDKHFEHKCVNLKTLNHDLYFVDPVTDAHLVFG